MSDRRRDLRRIASEVGITNILGMSKVSAKWVPRMLTIDQKGLGLIFLGISCLVMKMIPAILSSEL